MLTYNNSIILRSHAKINLSLDVLGKRPDGYHELKMIMQTIDLHDNVKVSRTLNAGQIELSSNSRFLPDNSKNIAYKAAKLILGSYPQETVGSGVKIYINKKIPIGAGLAGGSGNAAAVIKAMNTLFNLNLNIETMCSLGLQLGSDVPYCIRGGTMLAEGRGEILTPLTPIPKSIFLIINPGESLSTATIFSSIKDITSLAHPDTDLLLSYLNYGDVISLLKNAVNSLELPATAIMSSIPDVKDFMMKNGAHGTLMSGSGPTVFALYKDIKSAEKAKEAFLKSPLFKHKKYRLFTSCSC